MRQHLFAIFWHIWTFGSPPTLHSAAVAASGKAKPVPLLFRQTPNSSGKQRETTSSGTAGQGTSPQVQQSHRKFEMYFGC
jgi:hypothetical protein